MGTPSLPTFLKSFWLTPVNDWPIVTKYANACKYWQAERQYKCGTHDNYVRIWYWMLLSWWSSEHGDLRDVSFTLSGNRGYDRKRSVPSRVFTRHHGEFSIMDWYSILPWERLRAACPVQYTLPKIEHTPFPPIATPEGGISADRWR